MCQNVMKFFTNQSIVPCKVFELNRNGANTEP